MNKIRIPFTHAGFQKITTEYTDLQTKRVDAVNELTKARDMGDRSENAAYKSARRKLSSIDSRLRFLKRTIDNATIINPTNPNYVDIGMKIKVDNGQKELTFHIVGEHEADPMNARLSFRSPVGQALMGKMVEDVVKINVPSGQIEYRILKIELD